MPTTGSKNDFKSVDEYIAAQPKAVQPILERVRSTIRKAVPKADELISYKIPAYKLRRERLAAAFRKELAPYEIRKGTIRFRCRRPCL